jgi:hypothetical protein
MWQVAASIFWWDKLPQNQTFEIKIKHWLHFQDINDRVNILRYWHGKWIL